jgi:hypothetical protein
MLRSLGPAARGGWIFIDAPPANTYTLYPLLPTKPTRVDYSIALYLLV